MTISATLTKELPSSVSLKPVGGERYDMDVAGLHFEIAGDKELTAILQEYNQLIKSRGSDFITGTLKLFGKSKLMNETRAKENFKTGCLLLAIGKTRGESIASKLLIEPVHTAFNNEQAKIDQR